MQMDVHKTLYPFHPISLYWLKLNSQSFVENIVYISAISVMPFLFINWSSIHFVKHILQISHNLRIIKGEEKYER